MTDYTDPSTIDVDIVLGEINNAFKMRGDTWTDRLSWPNITVKALADEIACLRFENSHKFFFQLGGAFPQTTTWMGQEVDAREIRAQCSCGWKAKEDKACSLEENALWQWGQHVKKAAKKAGVTQRKEGPHG